MVSLSWRRSGEQQDIAAELLVFCLPSRPKSDPQSPKSRKQPYSPQGCQIPVQPLCTVLHFNSSASEKHSRAVKLITRLWHSGNGALSNQVLQEFHVISTRKIPQPISPSQAREGIRNLSHWLIVPTCADDIIAASELSENSQISFWDALIIRSAVVAVASILWSEDLQHRSV